MGNSQKRLLVQILYVLLLSLSTHSVFSRTRLSPHDEDDDSSSQYSTVVFDVAASIQRTLDALSSDSQTQVNPTHKQQTESSSSSSSFSLSLHPRSSLDKASGHHKDYKALTLSRLRRDSARFNSIAAELGLAAVNSTSQQLSPEDLQTPLTSGRLQGSGEYFSRVGVGRPARQYYMAIDTGSDISWIQCKPCLDCYQQSDPIFDPARSSTYRPLSCGSIQCRSMRISGCRNGKCLYQVSYGDGSFTIGDLATETLSFGNSGSVNNIAVGCGHDNEGLFAGMGGLLGLGGGPLSLPSQLKATSFSYCLVDRDSRGSSTLEFNSGRVRDSVTVPLLRSPRHPTFRFVRLTGLSVGGKPVGIPPSVFAVDGNGDGGVIVDCGTAVTRLNTQAYDSLRDAFARLTKNLPPSSGFAIFDTCYDLSSMKRASIPTVSFQFAGGKSINLPPENYLVPIDSRGKFCFAFAPMDQKLTIIGNIQQQGMRISYDLAKSVIGFSPNKC